MYTHTINPSNAFLCSFRYFKSHTLLVEQRLQKDKFPEVVRDSDVFLRYGHHLHHYRQPVRHLDLDLEPCYNCKYQYKDTWYYR